MLGDIVKEILHFHHQGYPRWGRLVNKESWIKFSLLYSSQVDRSKMLMTALCLSPVYYEISQPCKIISQAILTAVFG